MSRERLCIALDVMGGDRAPDAVIKAALLALDKYPDTRFLLYGDERRIAPLLERHAGLKGCSEVHHTPDVISNDEKPSVALRKGRRSSMALGIMAVRDNKADALVSAGNTGALMAMSKILLKTLPGIDRPAITGVLPTKKDNCIMLDIGANVDCDANNLFQFAVMGDAFARVMLGLPSPRIRLLNIGTEEAKGNESVREAAEMLRTVGNGLNFCGHIEGNAIAEGAADVIVTDGFSGNIALKTLEGTASMCVSFLRDAYKSSFLAWLGYLCSRAALRKFATKLDPRLHNGAMLLGLNGIVVKSHGGMDETGIANAIGTALRLASNDINAKIVEEMERSESALYPEA